MSFSRPDLLWLVFALPVVVGLGVLGYARRRRRVAALFGSAGLVERLGGGALLRFPTARLTLLTFAAAALGVAAAGPRWGYEVVEAGSRSLNVVLAVDVSKSMLARDLAPNRLERQRLLARRLLRELEGDRIGLVVFAGRAYVLSPLTVDHGGLQLYLDALDPGIVSQGGSSLASAIRQAADLAQGESQTSGEKVVVLMTDGEALEDESAVLDAAARAASLGVTVHAIGIGTASGAPVPDMDSFTGELRGYKRDPEGQVVVSRRGDALLERIAEITGGRYVQADRAGATDRLLAELRGLERARTEDGRRLVPREQYVWFVALALLLLTVDMLLERRSSAGWRAPARRNADDVALQEA